jgi:RNA polymerase sigma-70 factor (ECF subfamily)
VTEPQTQDGRNGGPSDHDLMARVARGERDALAALVRRHQRAVLSLAYRFLGRWDAAEDVTQDAFLRVLSGASRFRPEARFTTWLYRIVVNLCWDRRRKAARDPLPLAPETSAGPGYSAVDGLTRGERAARVRAAIAELPDRQRLALALHRFHDMSHKQIAEVTGWSVAAVESCLVRAYDRLRTLLADLQGESG